MRELELELSHGASRLPEKPPASELADLAKMMAETVRADADCAGVQASDVLMIIAESAASVLAASLRALSDMKQEPGPAARQLTS